MAPAHVLVLAKSPEPGRVKTRLCPPCTPAEAACLARASLADTLATVAACGADRRILALDGEPGEWLPPGFEVIPQIGTTLNERLAEAWAHAGAPGVQIGSDTPQLSPADLDDALARVTGPDRTDKPAAHAVLGLATDGGWWAVGMRLGRTGLFDGVPMSTPATGACQLARLEALGLRVDLLAVRRDVDTWDDACSIAGSHPHLGFSAAVRAIGRGTEPW